jgi:hypothetical protein
MSECGKERARDVDRHGKESKSKKLDWDARRPYDTSGLSKTFNHYSITARFQPVAILSSVQKCVPPYLPSWLPPFSLRPFPTHLLPRPSHPPFFDLIFQDILLQAECIEQSLRLESPSTAYEEH